MFPSAYYFRNCADLPDYLACAENLGVGDKLCDMLILDALTCNYDRHLNNIQFLVNSDSFEIIDLVPAFDNGMGLCSIKNFAFVNHKDYPVSEDRLSALNIFISYRIKRLIELYN